MKKLLRLGLLVVAYAVLVNSSAHAWDFTVTCDGGCTSCSESCGSYSVMMGGSCELDDPAYTTLPSPAGGNFCVCHCTDREGGGEGGGN